MEKKSHGLIKKCVKLKATYNIRNTPEVNNDTAMQILIFAIIIHHKKENEKQIHSQHSRKFGECTFK